MNVYFDHSGVLLGHAAGSPRVHFAADATITKQWATALAAARQPESSGHALTLAGLDAILTDPEKLAVFRAAASDFRAWLEHWTFVPPGLPPRLLGPTLWQAQAEFARAVGEHPWVYFLKARQLGESTIACAYDGWVARFGPPNARVHIFCQRDQNAVELLHDVGYGLELLPEFLRLPLTATAHSLTLDVGELSARLAEPGSAPLNQVREVEGRLSVPAPSDPSRRTGRCGGRACRRRRRGACRRSSLWRTICT